VHGSKVGDLTLIFRVIDATYENTGIEGSGNLKDAFGREISLIEGITCRGTIPDILVSQTILDKVHLEVVKHYQEFWNQSTSQAVIASEAFNLEAETTKLEYRVLKEYIFGSKASVPAPKEVPIDQETASEQQTSWQSSPTESCPGEIVSVACSIDGSFVAFRYDRTIVIRNFRTQRTENLYSERRIVGDSPVPVVISKDGRLLASGVIESADQNTVKVWDVNTKQETSFHGHKPSIFGRIRAIVITPNGKTLISGGDDAVKVWDIQSGGEFGDFLEHSSPVKAISISNDGQTVISGEVKGVIKFWNLRMRRSTHSIQAHSLPVNSIAISPDGKVAASCSDDYSIKLWNVRNAKEVCVLGQHSAPVNSIAFSPDGKLIVSAADDCRIKIWELASKQSIAVLTGHSRAVTSVAFIPSTQTIISGSRDCTMRLWYRA
jgi:WD40 repeat protein